VPRRQGAGQRRPVGWALPALARAVTLPRNPAGPGRLAAPVEAPEPQSATARAPDPPMWQESAVAAQEGRDPVGCRPRRLRAGRRARSQPGPLAPVRLLRLQRSGMAPAGLPRKRRREEHSARFRRPSPYGPAQRQRKLAHGPAVPQLAGPTAPNVPSEIGRTGLRDPDRWRELVNRPAPKERGRRC
jgi:hypothetical protein